MSHKVKPSVQSLKSMPADYRFLGSPPLSDPLGNSSSGSSVSVTIPRNGHLKNGFKATADSIGGVDNGNEDSPYSVSNGEVSSLVDGDLIVPLPQSTDRRWSDTSVYARKKVCLFFFWFGLVQQTLEQTFFFQVLQFWVQLPSGNWELGKVLSTSGEESVVKLPEGNVSEFFF